MAAWSKDIDKKDHNENNDLSFGFKPLPKIYTLLDVVKSETRIPPARVSISFLHAEHILRVYPDEIMKWFAMNYRYYQDVRDIFARFRQEVNLFKHTYKFIFYAAEHCTAPLLFKLIVDDNRDCLDHCEPGTTVTPIMKAVMTDNIHAIEILLNLGASLTKGSPHLAIVAHSSKYANTILQLLCDSKKMKASDIIEEYFDLLTDNTSMDILLFFLRTCVPFFTTERLEELKKRNIWNYRVQNELGTDLFIFYEAIRNNLDPEKCRLQRDLLQFIRKGDKQMVLGILRDPTYDIYYPMYDKSLLLENLYPINDFWVVRLLIAFRRDLWRLGIVSFFFKTVRENCYDNIKLLLDIGVNVNSKNQDGETALLLLARYPSKLSNLVAKRLMFRGADVNLPSKEGATVYIYHHIYNGVSSIPNFISDSANLCIGDYRRIYQFAIERANSKRRKVLRKQLKMYEESYSYRIRQYNLQETIRIRFYGRFEELCEKALLKYQN
jgi:ankyrin repeat protein